MKRNLLISILFFIATALMAVHEVQHIEHDHASCEICVLVNNFVSPDISVSLPLYDDFHFGAILTTPSQVYFHKQLFTTHSRAPPLFS